MRRGGGKQKGSQFERQICKTLSLWLSDGKLEDVLWRSAMSGGRSTVAHAKGKRFAAQAGDISSIHPLGHPFIETFMVECKSYRDLGYGSLLNQKGNLAKFWLQLNEECFKYSKFPLLVAKQNQLPVHVCLTGDGMSLLGLHDCEAMTVPPLNLSMILLDKFVEEAQWLWMQ